MAAKKADSMVVAMAATTAMMSVVSTAGRTGASKAEC